jgi:FkbM family methyltransferase
MLISRDDLTAAGVTPRFVLHVGAHTAEENDLYRALGANVVWVEAQEHLANNLARAGHNVIHAAIWSEPTNLTFHTTSNQQSSSLLPLASHAQRYPHITVTFTHTIRTTTIDSLNLQPDMLNLDIQGAELAALKGAEQTLTHVRWIYTEISIEHLYEAQPLEHELTEWLQQRGFEQVLRAMTSDGWGDALYARTLTPAG